MADEYISQVQLPNNETYDIKDKNAITEIQIVGETQTKTNGIVNLPAHVTQSNSVNGHYRTIMLGYDEISNDTPYSTSSVTNKVYKTEKFQYNPSGGILKNSGHIYIKSDNLDRDGEAPTSDQTGKSLYFMDKDSNGIGRIYTVQRKTDNKKDLFITVYNASGTSNSIGIRILDDGTPSYYLSYPSAFRTALSVSLSNGTITIGENSITPLTSHQSVTANNPTLSWGVKSKVATIGSTEINVTMPSNPNTNTWRNIKVNGNEKLGIGTGTGALNFKDGTNTTVTYDSGIKIDATDEKVKLTLLETDVEKTYYIPFKSVSTSIVYGNNGFIYQTKDGTTTVDGYGGLRLGNPTASGTEGNRFGYLRIYSKSTSYCDLIQADITSSVTHTLPSKGGTIFNTGNLVAGDNITLTLSNGVYSINGTSKLETETSIRSYLTSTVGHSCKNLLDLSKYTYSSGISDVVIDAATGSLSFTGTGTNRAVNFIAANLGVEMYGKTYTVSCINNLASTTTGRLTIRRRTTNTVIKSVSFSTTGNKSITFTPDEETFPDGWYISVMATGSTSATGDIDISNFMLREASIADDTFEPYVTPTDERIVSLEAENEARLEATVGHSGKNQLSYGSQNLTKTVAGVTFTVDLTAGTVIANGKSTSSSGSQYGILLTGDKYTRVLNYPARSIPNGKYYFCGCPVGGSDDNASYNVYIYDLNSGTRAKRWDGTTDVATDYGVENKNELLINDQSHSLVFNCRVYDTNGQNIIFRPMVWSGDIPDDSFEPYVTPTDEKKQDKPVVLWEGNITTNLTVNVGDNNYYSHYILTGVSDVKVDPFAETTAPAIFTVIIYSDMPGYYCVPNYDVYATLTISYQSSQGVTNMIINNQKELRLNKIIGIPK